MKWNLRWVAARRDIWRPSDLLGAFKTVGFTPSLSKVSALWSSKPIWTGSAPPWGAPSPT